MVVPSALRLPEPEDDRGREREPDDVEVGVSDH